MNKTAIKTFAIWARNKLIDDITYKAGLLGITDKEIKPPLPQSTSTVQFFDIGTKEPYAITGNDIEQRRKLVEALVNKDADHPTAFKNLVEEVAYTWFNRLIAVRFMEVNDYLPTRIRVLSSESPGKREPDLVTRPFDAELDYSQSEQQQIAHLQDNNLWDELFRMLFIKQCNAFNAVLPELFEKTNDYTELLMNVSFTDQDGVVFHLVNDIDEDDFNVEKEGQVEIIGWLYQYYNTEPKDEVFALLKKNVKITKERIPAATQLFTPDWIVRYMVENSLGRLWLEGHPNDSLKADWKYYLDEAEQEPEVQKQLDVIREEYKNIRPEEIKIIDPCMGSGHILVYAFDVLMAIYESMGYSQRDAAKSILENNLFGLDIDTRAYQLAYFALMMKARQYNRRILNGKNRPKVYAFAESNGLNRTHLYALDTGFDKEEREVAVAQIEKLLQTFVDANEYGSILKMEDLNWELLRSYADSSITRGQINIDSIGVEATIERFKGLIELGQVLAQKYEVVVTNPPYMGSSGMGTKLSDFVKKQYPDSKADLFAVCIEKGNEMLKPNGYNCMVTMQSWMFLPSFEKMRAKLLTTKTITNLMHMENMVMGIAFGTAVAVFREHHIKNFKGTYNLIKLADVKEDQPVEFPVIGNRFAQVSTENFSKIPGMPIAYWASKTLIEDFIVGDRMDSIVKPKQGLATADNDRFLRQWFEVNINKISFVCETLDASKTAHRKWFPYNKGGVRRQWYGNYDYVVNWENDGKEIRNFKDNKGKVRSRPQNTDFYFRESITWSLITSGGFSIRYRKIGSIHDVAGMSAFSEDHELILYILGLLSTKIANYVFKMLNPTINLQIGDFNNFPVIRTGNKMIILDIVRRNISISQTDWDSFETSWDFKTHPLLAFRTNVDLGVLRSYEQDENGHLVDTETTLGNGGIQTAFERWQDFTELQFTQLKQNEEELNRIFIDIYGLQDELTPEIEDKDVTVRRADLGREIRSFISYAVGCMFGRYSLDTEGLAYAGGDWDSGKYQTFIPDQDNVLPITDEEYFEDDVVGLFVAFVKKVYGEATLENNLDFIANALGNKGNTSREIIRNYFLKDFFKDHCKVYQKRPIYWLFDSGKENGFKALIYLHRYNTDTIGNLRIDYLHRMQKVYESEMARMQETIDNSTNPRDVSAATKRKEKLIKQLKETKEYDEKIAHLALARIELDLDDGVKVNYEKVQTDVEGKKIQVLGKI
ncbi:BREX-1 system adenine-specific DNA-methyltransferase PglX [Acetobacterium fimetarium]|uniref:site-specific DNA-methyltransferase (adenine-specific) n=1 Tax=Acetobacterium fimetarium TaxID=52691 RepID=A0ABR6WW87_9FIRM|nr:BREX-1 system adenine-specific DNA-methyltransferase PglX [Acetobacterium fimetarium]MBC3804625.1 BREX-1 system adenine-specific DNA-methyltransferase PglX [Acetobacterium fimetarium]